MEKNHKRVGKENRVGTSMKSEIAGTGGNMGNDMGSNQRTFRKGRARLALFFCCLASLLLTACGKTEQESAASDQVYYHFQETSFPDPDEALSGVFAQEYMILEQGSAAARRRLLPLCPMCRP